MVDRDFSVFDRVVGEIISGLDDAAREAIKRRINAELDRCELLTESKAYEQYVETRERIRAIERKALARLGEHGAQPLEQGKRCSLCAQYESDILVISLGKVHAVCRECIVLAKQIAEEDNDGQRSN